MRVWLEDRGAGPVLIVAASPTQKASEVLQRVLEKGSAKDKQLANQLQTQVMTVESKGKELERSIPGMDKGAMPGGGRMPGSGAMVVQQRMDVETKEKPIADGFGDLVCWLKMKAGKCFGDRVRWWNIQGLMELRNKCVGRRALTVPGEDAEGPLPDARSLRLIHLTLDYGGGNGVDAVLLRHVEELQALGIVAGAIHRLDLSEMGVAGWARVRSVEPCPALEAGAGKLVTGWFHHWRGVVYDLRVEGEPEPLRVTALHPFWSVDRQAWVPLSELQRGERLSAWDGSTPMVESLTLREAPEPVYNIEVEGDHCYRVGQQGLLVHNQSAPGGQAETGQAAGAAQCGCAARLANYRRQCFTPSRIVREEGISSTPHYLWWLACNIAHAAGVRPQSGSTPVVSVALVCEEGSNVFKIYVSYNLRRGADAVRAAAEAVLGPGHWIDPQPPTHAEQNIVNYFQNAQHRGDIAGVAASRCICPSCVTVLSTGNQLASPRGNMAVPTCNQDGTPANPQARQWCQDGRSPIPFNQQF